ncbi:hypothetical protein M23134_06811 [Microscilla marina ATCC 23134]|uniref:Class I SAM-dependent methyltransferase n=2 Tax=Microscilla marina TaxID=1027 RepID=A1ZQ01_MICM2|nr:hypothetical protein M23134_06811 [Microscilla marina ATCC 23134]
MSPKKMPRLHLFEIEDFPWYPAVIREGQTDFLRFMMQTFDVFRAVIPHLREAQQKSDRHHLVDFCSGGGGSMLLIRKHLKQDSKTPFRATLSDLYPNIKAFEYVQKASNGDIDFKTTPVDAANPPADTPQGFWTIFNGFHHFRPAQAQQILATAVERKTPIGIFEPIDKSLFQIIINTIVLLVLMLVLTPFVRPFKWSRLLFTYLVPVIPLCTIWDGFVSVLRLYTPKDLRQMVSAIPETEAYEWKIGKARHMFGTVIYLIGYSKPAKLPM